MNIICLKTVGRKSLVLIWKKMCVAPKYILNNIKTQCKVFNSKYK